MARLLGITLVHFPFYSPDLNPIEQVWKSLKKGLSTRFPLTANELADAITTVYYELVKTTKCAKAWITEILEDNYKND